MSSLEVGFGRRDITPERERQTIYDSRPGLDRSYADEDIPIRDRLYAHATAFRRGEQTALWVTLDVCVVDGPFRDRVAAHLARRGVSPEHLAVTASHTHTAPTVARFHGVRPTPSAYMEHLVAECVAAAEEALRDLGPAELAFGKTTLDLSVNRRQIGRIAQINDLDAPAGLVDPGVAVAYATREDGRKGLLFNYAAHPLTMTRRVPQISADYPGYAATRLESAGYDFAQFLQGCAGNVNVKITGDVREAEKAGRMLAEAVEAAGRDAAPTSADDLIMITRTVRLPWEKLPSIQEARASLEAARSRKVPSGPPGRHLEWAESLVAALEHGKMKPYGEVIVQAMRVGDAVFVALPGEVFAEIGLSIRRRAGVEHLFIAAYANTGEIGYIPTAAAFEEGGYEVDVAPFYYGLLRLSPECERILIDEALSAVEAVRLRPRAHARGQRSP